MSTRNDFRPRMAPPCSMLNPRTSYPEGFSVSAKSRKDILRKWKAACQRDQKDLPGKGGPLLAAFPFCLRYLFCLEDQHSCVFREVHATLVAFAAVVLNVPTGRAGKSKRRVATCAELHLFGILLTAFGALHR